MVINHNVNTTIITNNNLDVLKEFAGEVIINDIEDIKHTNASFVVFNDVLRMLKEADLERLIKLLEKKGMHFANITSNMEEALYSQILIVYVDGKIEVEGPVISVLKEEKLLKRLGFSLPFIYDLSLQLNYYGLIDSIYLDERTLADKLW